MTRFAKLLCLLVAILMLAGCASNANNPTAPVEDTSFTDPTVSQEPRPPLQERLDYYATLGSSPDDNYRVWYEIFVYSFCDTNADGIGDLQGVISKLDYLQELGVNGIWLMPIHPSTSYHKYNVDDYYAIDPQYGTMEDFDQLMAECEKRNIKVILDLVVNHSGNNNIWFTEACDYLKTLDWGYEGNVEDCKYFGYYNFTREATYGYNRIPGTEYYYECRFSHDMPDLNLDNQDLRADIEAVMKFWMDKGVGGFRVDAAKEFYTGNITKNAEALAWLQQTATSIDPDAYMVAEIWDNFNAVTSHYQSGFTSIFNYPFGDYAGKLIKVVNSRGNATIVNTWATALQTANEAYKGKNPNYIDAPFLSNHDVGRIFGFVNGDEVRIKMAGAMNLFMSGSAFIYYGEEIGMPGEGNDPSKRAPMRWTNDSSGGGTALPPGCVLPSKGYPLGTLADQQDDEDSVYNFYREAIAIRKALPVISHGDSTAETALNVGCISAVRKTWESEECIILMNINDEADTVDLTAYADWTMVATLSPDGNPTVMDGTTLHMAPYGIAVLIPG